MNDFQIRPGSGLNRAPGEGLASRDFLENERTDMRGYEMEKNSSGAMNPAEPAKAPQAAPEKTPAEMQSNIDGILDRSADRQRARGQAESKAASDKAAKIAVIYDAAQHLNKRGPLNAHGLYQWISLNAKTPRPGGADEFMTLVAEMIHTGLLSLSGGTLQSPPTKIYLRALEYRLDV